MSVNERARLLAQLGAIHDQWLEDIQADDEENATPEQWAEYQALIGPIMRRLKELTGGPVTASAGDSTAVEDKVSDSVEFHLAVNGDLVQMLVKHDFDEGILYYRESGEWVSVTPEQELPALDESDLIEVIGEATEIWDAAEGGELKLSDFKLSLLDEI